MSEKKLLAVRDWACAMNDELGRVVLKVTTTDGEPVVLLMTVFQAARMARDLQSPKRVPLSI